jgi:hypothetical protein
MRHPFCRYSYDLTLGKAFERYGLEQQAEIMRHIFMKRLGHAAGHPGSEQLAALERRLPFGDPGRS